VNELIRTYVDAQVLHGAHKMNNEKLDFSLSLYDFMILKRIYDKKILFERNHKWLVNPNEVLS